VNNIMAGKIATDRMRAVDRATSERMGISVAEAEARTVALIPLGRYGTADEFGRAAAWLLSDSASYITGTSVQVDGGLVQCVM
jgi:3-oxoacyl-[acyl-carrier protein] reductase